MSDMTGKMCRASMAACVDNYADIIRRQTTEIDRMESEIESLRARVAELESQLKSETQHADGMTTAHAIVCKDLAFYEDDALRWSAQVEDLEAKLAREIQDKSVSDLLLKTAEDRVAELETAWSKAVADYESEAVKLVKSQERVAELEVAGKWIGVDERLPESGVYVLTVDRYGEIDVAKYIDDKWISYYDYIVNCSYWLHLPAAPKGGAQ